MPFYQVCFQKDRAETGLSARSTELQAVLKKVTTKLNSRLFTRGRRDHKFGKCMGRGGGECTSTRPFSSVLHSLLSTQIYAIITRETSDFYCVALVTECANFDGQ